MEAMMSSLWRLKNLALAVMLIPLTLWSAEITAPAATSKEQLQSEIHNTMEARQAALLQIRERYQAAKSEERTALGREMAQTTEQYERQYLRLLVEYHSLTGNPVEKEHAQRMLDALDGVPLARPDAAQHDAIQRQTNGGEGVTIHAQ
jgi:hypothetical protein